MKQVIVRPVIAVGMHHYGRSGLSVGAVYRLESEPLNPYDKNAVAIFDGPRKVGNLMRDSAAVVATVMRLNLAKSGRYIIKPVDECGVKNRRIGPQQLCHMYFQIDASSETEVRNELKMHARVSVTIN